MAKQLVDVYMERDIYFSGDEILYAVFPGGGVMECHRKFSTTFYNPDDVWVAVDKVPSRVEFIGKYYL